jgi:uncharacterized membrane protein SpoIIM required for sporulation
MISARWIGKRKPYWDRLGAVIAKAGRGGIGALTFPELSELGSLYRQIAADLASVREDPLSQPWAMYLNGLLARAHNLIYMGHPVRPRGIVGFYRRQFPRVFRQTWRYTGLAFLIFVAGALAGFFTSLADPAFQRFFLGPQMSASIDRREMWTHSVLTIKPLASSAIMTNNLTVSFTAFAAGILGGIGTAYLMAMNGVVMGVIGAACWQAGMSLQLWSFVAPHGALELPAVFIAGGGGLLLARGLLFPGELPRRESLTFYGGQGVRLALGIIPLLVVAGVLEGFFSPSYLPAAAKFVCSAAMGWLLFLYLVFGGREQSQPDPAAANSLPKAAK